jgi:hypothetical protein
MERGKLKAQTPPSRFQANLVGFDRFLPDLADFSP